MKDEELDAHIENAQNKVVVDLRDLTLLVKEKKRRVPDGITLEELENFHRKIVGDSD